MPRTNATTSGGGEHEAQLGLVLGALSDATRRRMLESMLRDGSGSVPTLSSEFPISRQAVAKHIAALHTAGLIERERSAGREVIYRPRPAALRPVADWLAEADAAWSDRLGRLKHAVESGGQRDG